MGYGFIRNVVRFMEEFNYINPDMYELSYQTLASQGLNLGKDLLPSGVSEGYYYSRVERSDL